MKTYSDLVRYLETFIPKDQYLYPREKGLARMKELLRLLGNPHQAYQSIHVVGTAGKGSTATILAHILTISGYKTGLTISPHLQVVLERIQIDGCFVPLTIAIKLIEHKLKPAIGKMVKASWGKPSYFELLLALAFVVFQEMKVTIAMVESGLGGTWDASCALDPTIGILTTVGLDHTQVLGTTVEEITRDKIGNIRPNMIVISGVKQEKVKKMVVNKSKQQKARLILLNRDFHFTINKLTNKGSYFDFNINSLTYKNLFISLVGKHQVENAALAIAATFALKERNYRIEENQLRHALATVVFPGRLEVVQKQPLVVLDGAHNPDKIQALIDALPLYTPARRVGVVAFKKGKNIEPMLKLLLSHLSHLVVTEFSLAMDMGKRLSTSTSEIMAIVRFIQEKDKEKPILVEEQPHAQKAVDRALTLAGKGDMILITGSLYLVGEVRERWYPKAKLIF